MPLYNFYEHKIIVYMLFMGTYISDKSTKIYKGITKNILRFQLSLWRKKGKKGEMSWIFW